MDKSYGIRLTDKHPEEAQAMAFIEDYLAQHYRNNVKQLLMELIANERNREVVVEPAPSPTAEMISANFAELFNWLGQLPEFMKELKRQTVTEIMDAIAKQGGRVEFTPLPDLSAATQQELDKASKEQRQRIMDLMELG